MQEMLFPYFVQAEGLKLAALTFEKDAFKLSCCAGQQAKEIIVSSLSATVSLAGFAIIALIYWIRKR
ncbi:MAG: hypothetical protein KAJ96_04315 [Candidatus Thorarchaeota archaeon]|nr:hypothetical protein [Candidatus Thorarchaeota archaeon]